MNWTNYRKIAIINVQNVQKKNDSEDLTLSVLINFNE